MTLLDTLITFQGEFIKMILYTHSKTNYCPSIQNYTLIFDAFILWTHACKTDVSSPGDTMIELQAKGQGWTAFCMMLWVTKAPTNVIIGHYCDHTKHGGIFLLQNPDQQLLLLLSVTILNHSTKYVTHAHSE